MPLPLLLLLAAGWLAQLQLQRWHTFTAPNPKAAATFYAKCNAHEIIYRLMTCCSKVARVVVECNNKMCLQQEDAKYEKTKKNRHSKKKEN